MGSAARNRRRNRSWDGSIAVEVVGVGAAVGAVVAIGVE